MSRAQYTQISRKNEHLFLRPGEGKWPYQNPLFLGTMTPFSARQREWDNHELDLVFSNPNDEIGRAHV